MLKYSAIIHMVELKNGFNVYKDGKIVNNDIVELNQTIKSGKLKKIKGN